MKLTILKDKKITNREMTRLTNSFSNWYDINADIKPQFFIEETDFSDYPTYTDSDGDIRPTDAFLRSIGKDVYKRYSGEGTDHIVLLIHEDNWKSPTIWGTNYSNVYSGYQLHYCRFDRDNPANSFGTFYHEVHHSHDAFIKTYQGVDIEPLVSVTRWDRGCTHGNEHTWKYIRYQENAESLIAIKDLLKASYSKRQAIYDQKVGNMKRQVQLLEQILIIIRQLLNMKNGIRK